MRRLLLPLVAVAVVVAVVVGLSQAGDDGQGAGRPQSALSLQEARERVKGAPPALAALHRDANTLRPADRESFRDAMRELRGHPVVVNKWASWCGPCKAEFPFFQRVAADLGDEVAFLGLNAGDQRPAAREFLDRFPVLYPSLEDPKERISRDIGAANAYPVTLFYDASGELQYAHQGGYATEAKLREDIERYAR